MLSDTKHGEETRKSSLFSTPEEMRHYITKGIELYRKVSPHINAKTKEKTDEYIFNFIKTHPGIRPTEISQNLKLRIRTLMEYLARLKNNGLIKDVQDDKNKRAKMYYAT
jgi:DNA-binding transcriptional ArsR family regulator